MARLNSDMLRDWIEPLIEAQKPKVKVVGGRIPDMPDRCVLITPSGNGTDHMEGVFEIRGYRFLCRGSSNSAYDAEEIANIVHDIVDGQVNFDITNEVTVLWMRPVGKPRQLEITDSQSRFRFMQEVEVCSSQD